MREKLVPKEDARVSGIELLTSYLATNIACRPYLSFSRGRPGRGGSSRIRAPPLACDKGVMGCLPSICTGIVTHTPALPTAWNLSILIRPGRH